MKDHKSNQTFQPFYPLSYPSYKTTSFRSPPCAEDLSRYLQIPDEELNAVEEETGKETRQEVKMCQDWNRRIMFIMIESKSRCFVFPSINLPLVSSLLFPSKTLTAVFEHDEVGSCSTRTSSGPRSIGSSSARWRASAWPGEASGERRWEIWWIVCICWHFFNALLYHSRQTLLISSVYTPW